MKRFFKVSCVCFLLILSSIFLSACNKQVTVDFVRFYIGQRQTDYYLDFTLKINNPTGNIVIIDNSDFYVKVNDEEFYSVAFLYENEETFYAAVNVESNGHLTLRARVVTANLKNKDRNYIAIKYKDSLIVEDNIYVSKS